MALSLLYILGIEANFWPVTNRFSPLQSSWVVLCPCGELLKDLAGLWWPHFLWSLGASLHHCNLACLSLKQVGESGNAKRPLFSFPGADHVGLSMSLLWAVPVQVHNMLGYRQVSVLSPDEVPHGFHWVSQITKGCRKGLVKALIRTEEIPSPDYQTVLHLLFAMYF